MRRLALLPALFLAACLELGGGAESADDGSASSEATLGRYEVDAALTSQSCGTGTLALPEALAFLVDLSSDDDDVLTWGEGGLALTGKRAVDGIGFTVTTASVVDARAGSTNEQLPPCRIERTDRIEGKLDAAEEPTSFTAKLTISYEPEAGSDCRDLLFGPERLVQALPCTARYDLDGRRK